jgi:periplasmic protein TonB
MIVMINPDLQRHSPLAEQALSFSLKKRVVQQVFAAVVTIHVIIFLVAIFGFPTFKIARKPDITIEIGAAPPASSGPASIAKPTSPVASKIQPKETAQPMAQDPDSPVAKSQPQRSSAAPPPVSSASGGPASAPTVDADYKASYLQNPKPPYPPLAFRLRAEGKVILIAEVLPNGQSGSVQILESSGNEMLDKSALETVKKWRFTPARKDGVIVTQAVRIPITFSLKNR